MGRHDRGGSRRRWQIDHRRLFDLIAADLNDEALCDADIPVDAGALSRLQWNAEMIPASLID